MAMDRHDGVTIALHWVTEALVIALFGMTLWWTYAPRSIGFRFELEDLHISLGIVLVAVLIARLIWRGLHRHSPFAPVTLLDRLASYGHWLLYALLIGQVTLGVILSGLQGAELSAFGLFTIPLPLGRDRPMAEIFETLHYWTAWGLVVVAGGHAAMALFHHYVLRDGVLRRMLPTAGR